MAVLRLPAAVAHESTGDLFLTDGEKVDGKTMWYTTNPDLVDRMGNYYTVQFDPERWQELAIAHLDKMDDEWDTKIDAS